jgi:hypothetical protein
VLLLRVVVVVASPLLLPWLLQKPGWHRAGLQLLDRLGIRMGS